MVQHACIFIIPPSPAISIINMDDETSTQSIIMAALSTLTPCQFSHLTHSLSFLLRTHHRRLYSVVSIPTLFSLTFRYLQSLSLRDKSLLIARHLLSNLTILLTPFHVHHHFINTTPYNSMMMMMKLRDLDAVVLLLLLCEIRQMFPQALECPISNWRIVLCDYLFNNLDLFTLSGIQASASDVVNKYVHTVSKCTRFVNLTGGNIIHAGSSGKHRTEVATSVSAIIALPSVEVMGGGRECVICKEEITKGRDVCELPCKHMFHWMCILPWLMKRNTCPCCRYMLPTDDVVGEIHRLWGLLSKIAAHAT